MVANSGIEILILFNLKKIRQIIDQAWPRMLKSVRNAEKFVKTTFHFNTTQHFTILLVYWEVLKCGIEIWYWFLPTGENQYPISISYFDTYPVTKEKFRENDVFLLNWRNFHFPLIWRKICVLVSKIPYSFYIVDYKIM